MKNEKQIKEYLEIRKETLTKTYFTCDVEDYCKEVGFIEALEWVLEDNNNEQN